MPAEVLKFRKVGESTFKVEIWGDFPHDYGVMSVAEMVPFLNRLKVICATTNEVIEALRECKEGADFVIEKPQRTG